MGGGWGWSKLDHKATLWLHLASWNLPNSQLSWESKMEPKCGKKEIIYAHEINSVSYGSRTLARLPLRELLGWIPLHTIIKAETWEESPWLTQNWKNTYVLKWYLCNFQCLAPFLVENHLEFHYFLFNPSLTLCYIFHRSQKKGQKQGCFKVIFPVF